MKNVATRNTKINGKVLIGFLLVIFLYFVVYTPGMGILAILGLYSYYAGIILTIWGLIEIHYKGGKGKYLAFITLALVLFSVLTMLFKIIYIKQKYY